MMLDRPTLPLAGAFADFRLAVFRGASAVCLFGGAAASFGACA
jgi:hypothetical protein